MNKYEQAVICDLSLSQFVGKREISASEHINKANDIMIDLSPQSDVGR